MNTILDYNILIHDEIITPLEQSLRGEQSVLNTNYGGVVYIAQEVRRNDEGRRLLDTAMQPYYMRYINGEIPRMGEAYSAHGFIHLLMEEYEGLGDWIGGQDFMQITASMLANRCDSEHLFDILELLISHGYGKYIKDWPKENIETEIEMLEMAGSRERGEFLCILHAYYMIERSDANDGHKDELESLLRENWHFLQHVYSIMVKRIVGFEIANFMGVVNNINQSAKCYKYIHIFYNAVILRQDDLFPEEKKKQQLVKHMTTLEQRWHATDQSDDLDELCSIIYGAEFEEIMRRERFKPYKELLEENRQLKANALSFQGEKQRLLQELRDAVESRVPVSEIESAILMLDNRTAWEVFAQLNAMLLGEHAWMNYAQPIRDKLRARQRSETQVINGDYYASGAVHQDNSRELCILNRCAEDPPELSVN